METLTIIPGGQFSHAFALVDADGIALEGVLSVGVVIELAGVEYLAADLSGADGAWTLALSGTRTASLPAEKSLRYVLTIAFYDGATPLTFRGIVETMRTPIEYVAGHGVTGVSSETGKHISGVDHLRQSIIDILQTRIGTRVMRRDYGSNIPNIVDAPINEDLRVDLYVAVAEALDKWEPRLTLTSIEFESVSEGKVTLVLTGEYLPDGEEITLEGILVQ
ncbi:GPW/gp25 family protein [Breoghania sp.]|uniref:GPW/gp25 family protein n=1 Tax=Breoghania sp. TaxID=2065378 RepID=UPI002AA88DF7|nr:GPW/gp25 family protein [Breoghania sp.]